MRFFYRFRGIAIAAFGAGLIIALCFPTKIMIFIVAALLVIMGIAAVRC